MNKAELIAAIAAKTGDTKKVAEATVNAFVETVMTTVPLPCATSLLPRRTRSGGKKLSNNLLWYIDPGG